MPSTLPTHLSSLAHYYPGEPDGLATLDATGRVPASQLPTGVVGSVNYQGMWDASTNTPTLANGVGTKGSYYVVSTAGNTVLDGISQWYVGDAAIFNGTDWDRLDGSANEVLSVAGQVGNVSLSVSDIAGAAPLASPVLTGNPTAPTQIATTNNTTIATTAFVKTSIANDIFPISTRMLFAQASAPVGWTQDVTDAANNRMLRVVNGAGGSNGGVHDPILMNVVPSHTHTFSTGNESATHSHIDAGHLHAADGMLTAGGGGSGWSAGSGTVVMQTGGGTANLGAETATHTHSGTTAGNGGASNWTPRYTDLIICQKD